ncbi:MAG: VOC family protein [Chloroflexota bacterium]
MTEQSKSQIGKVLWQDLTVENAEAIRDFYSRVIGWEFNPVDCGGYDDYNMLPPGSGEPAAGVCHARGINADLPPLWLVYVSVEDVDASVRRCLDLGGKVLHGPRPTGENKICVIQDPAGAVLALYGN